MDRNHTRSGVGRTVILIIVGLLIASIGALLLTGSLNQVIGQTSSTFLAIIGDAGSVDVPSLGGGNGGLIPILLARRR